MRKLIEAVQEYIITCDNKQCDYKVPNPTKDPNTDISMYLNKPCPKCKQNLLTEHDYLLFLKTTRVINFINKYFSWLTLFSTIRNTPVKSGFIHMHKQIKITDGPSN